MVGGGPDRLRFMVNASLCFMNFVLATTAVDKEKRIIYLNYEIPK